MLELTQSTTIASKGQYLSMTISVDDNAPSVDDNAPRTASIGDVERETGLSKDTLRVWERRYGFPAPARNFKAERIYPEDQIQRLRIIRRLLDAGLRPGKIVGLPLEQLGALMEPVGSSPVKSPREPGAREPGARVPATEAATADAVDWPQQALQLIRSHRAHELRHQLAHLLLQLGLRQFILDVVVPLNALVGNAWLRGAIEIFEEHLYTAQVQSLLQHALGAMPPSGLAPRVLLTTLPGEEHQLGLLMAHAFFAMQGAQCVPLGTETPPSDILKAVDAHQVDIVGLSCTGANLPRATHAMLSALRENLDVRIEIWVGGSASLDEHKMAGIRRVVSLTEIPAALACWRANCA
jgi:DNA-binding transcriptional MerR regulator/methylmalonyl-CoA mutase cobalamin-binding subunit